MGKGGIIAIVVVVAVIVLAAVWLGLGFALSQFHGPGGDRGARGGGLQQGRRER